MLDRAGMRFGPYLLFLRSRIGFSDFHDFTDWPPLGNALDRQMWDDADAVITMFSKPRNINLGPIEDLPDWIDFLELASISADYASRANTIRQRYVNRYDRTTRISYSDEDEFFPAVANMMIMCEPGATPDKPTFDRRLVLISYEDADDPENVCVGEAARQVLRSTEGVWHSRGIYGLAARDQRPPQAILQGLDRIVRHDAVSDIGIFRLADAVPLCPSVSPLQAFLGR